MKNFSQLQFIHNNILLLKICRYLQLKFFFPSFTGTKPENGTTPEAAEVTKVDDVAADVNKVDESKAVEPQNVSEAEGQVKVINKRNNY